MIIMNIAVCDDNIQVLGKLEKIVYDCFGGDSNQLLCDIFLSGEELVGKIQTDKNRYQIYILDIEMTGINGLQVASFLRKEDYNAIIIFITNHKELMQEAFDVVAFNYLLKPIDEEKTKQVILRAMQFLSLKKSVFQFKKRKRIYTVNNDEIQYFESNKRKMYIYTDYNVYEYYDTIKNVLEKVELKLYVQVHTSFIVNMDYIETVYKEYVILKCGINIAITKKYFKSFNSSYRNFILMRIN